MSISTVRVCRSARCCTKPTNESYNSCCSHLKFQGCIGVDDCEGFAVIRGRLGQTVIMHIQFFLGSEKGRNNVD